MFLYVFFPVESIFTKCIHDNENNFIFFTLFGSILRSKKDQTNNTNFRNRVPSKIYESKIFMPYVKVVRIKLALLQALHSFTPSP